MTDIAASVQTIVSKISPLTPRAYRKLIAIAGAPASGKSTLAEAVADQINHIGGAAQVVPMDGFHLDNSILDARELRARKGAPDTFDAAGFSSLIARLAHEPEVIYPTFDRSRDLSLGCSGVVGPKCDTVIVEGNYLLLDAPDWRDLAAHWDYSVLLNVPEDELRRRLTDRWLAYGHTPEEAQARAEQNDIPNALVVQRQSIAANLVLG